MNRFIYDRFEEIHLGDSVANIGWYNYSRATTTRLGVHSHGDCLEVCYLARGRQVYRVGGRDYVMCSGDVHLTFPHEEHSSGSWPEGKGTLYWAVLRMPRRGRSFLGQRYALAKPLVDRLLNVPSRSFKGTRRLGELFDAVFEACVELPEELRSVAAAARITELLLAIGDCGHRAQSDRASEDINSILSYIDAHPEMPVDVGVLAEQMGLSPSWFKAKFRQQVGLSPADYVLRRKMELAKDMLAGGPGASCGVMSIASIARRLGFSSGGYFSTVFKRYTGMTPSDWRQTED